MCCMLVRASTTKHDKKKVLLDSCFFMQSTSFHCPLQQLHLTATKCGEFVTPYFSALTPPNPCWKQLVSTQPVDLSPKESLDDPQDGLNVVLGKVFFERLCNFILSHLDVEGKPYSNSPSKDSQVTLGK